MTPSSHSAARRHTRRATAGALATILVATLAAQAGTGASAATVPTITIDTDTVVSEVPELAFGANGVFQFANLGGADPVTGEPYQTLIKAMRQTGVSVHRYPGGKAAGLFEFERAIGAQSQREDQVVSDVGNPSTFGPDEVGTELDKTGASGSLMLNWGTRNAEEAANFVEYMAAPAGQGFEWADRRAANGHHKPYDISFAEMGNEASFGQLFWAGGVDQRDPVKATPVAYNNPACASIDSVACLYAFGGTTAFTQQKVVKRTDWTPAAGVSDGSAGQTFQTMYSPVITTATTLYVDGVAWNQVSSLNEAGQENVYAINAKTGVITFGDGTHGNIPPEGAKLSISYHTGPHDGYVDYRREVRKISTDIPVCSSLDTPGFMKVMGQTHTYDCLIKHPYHAIRGTSPENYADELQTIPALVEASMEELREEVVTYAGEKRAKEIGIYVTEYGVIPVERQWDPDGNTGVWHAVGLTVAAQLAKMLEGGIAGATWQKLTNYTWEPFPQPTPAQPGLAMYAGPGPDLVVEPPALTLELIGKTRGNEVLANSIADNPSTVLTSGRTKESIQAFTTRAPDGRLMLVLFNRDFTKAIETSIVLGSGTASGKKVEANVSTVAGAFNAYNTRDDKDAVRIVKSSAQVGTGTFRWVLPAGSMTLIELPATAAP